MQRAFTRDLGCRRQSLLPLCILLLLGCSQRSSHVDPERLFDTTRRELGAVRVDADYSATYRITNSTPAPLSVTGITTSCGCVAADYDRSEIKPGEHRDIVLNLSTHGQTVIGPLVKHASVEFASGQKAFLTLSARLETEFDVEPRRLEFSADKRTHTVSLIRRQLDASAFSSLVLVAQPERYDVAEEPSSTAGRRDFRITMKEESAGTSLPEIYFATAPGGSPLPFSTVICSRTGPSLRPSAFVVVVTNSASKPPAQRFELVDFQSQPLKITAVEPLDDRSRSALRVSFNPLEDAKSFSLALAEAPSGSLTNLAVAVNFETIDGGATGRLLLPCHVLTPVANKGPAP